MEYDYPSLERRNIIVIKTRKIGIFIRLSVFNQEYPMLDRGSYFSLRCGIYNILIFVSLCDKNDF